jgi:hypothetical protein
MAERESEQEDHFNLLPFIAILMCVLGTELLVTMSMATISLGAGAGEGWVPSHQPGTSPKTPILIEWDGNVAIIHRADKRLRVAVVFPETGGPPELEPFFQEMASRRDSDYALLAVRPSGFENYFRLVNEFRKRKIDVGYEPIEQGKSVRVVLAGAPQ